MKPEFDDELLFIEEIEQAIRQAADCIHNATEWWEAEDNGPRTIDTLIGMILVAAKKWERRR